MIKTFRINQKDLKFKIRSDADSSVFDEIFKEREYKILDPIIKNSKTAILDIGAHIGLFSVYSRTFNLNAPIFAYEPDEDNFAVLKENLKSNAVQNIRIKMLAVSNKTQNEKMFLSPDSHNHSLLAEAKVDSNKWKNVQTTTLDKILEKIIACDLIKIDCEGAEFKIIEAVSPDSFKKIRAIYIEYHEFTEDLKKEKIADILRKNHFSDIKIIPSYHDKKMGFILAVK